jgi:hypothetical protein
MAQALPGYLRAFRLLRKSIIISRLAGIFILLLFTLSVTPKRFLHDVLAHHQDSEHRVSDDVQQFFASGFQCHADDLVVDTPFLQEPGAVPSIIIPFSEFGYASPLFARLARNVIVSAVRGPPVPAVS